ncbi:MAG TPA: hypothetical protein VNE63_23685 [Candidatus Acidoferrales bacterium]|nr:hypothetical protein [Candidatus Acidoferrales bacterium]
MRRTKNALTAPCAKPVASTATRAFRQLFPRVPRNRRTVSSCGSVDGLIVQTPQETIQGREIGHAGKPQHLTQFAMLAQPDLGIEEAVLAILCLMRYED